MAVTDTLKEIQSGDQSIRPGFARQTVAALTPDLRGLIAEEERGEFLGGVGRLRRHAQRLRDGFVEIAWNENVFPGRVSQDKRECRERSVGVAALSELERLLDVLGLDDLRRQLVIQLRVCQRLDSGFAIGGGLGIGDGDLHDGGSCQVVECLRVGLGVGAVPQDELADGVNGNRRADKKVLIGQLIGGLRVGGDEYLERCAVFQLLGKQLGRAVDGDDRNSGFLLERREDLRLEDFFQVRGGGDLDGLIGARGGQKVQEREGKGEEPSSPPGTGGAETYSPPFLRRG